MFSRLKMSEKVYISKKMQGKMLGFHTLNTSPLDNMFCEAMSRNPKSICHNCYSRRGLRTYNPHGRVPWKRNGQILSSKVLDDADLPVISKEYFRFQSHGELINENHYINLVNIAKKNPNTAFLLPTKRIDIVNKHGKMGATNLILSYSEPLVNHPVKKLPKHFNRRFSVFTPEYAEEHNIDINCAGKRCMDCLQCYRIGNNLKWVNELIR